MGDTTAYIILRENADRDEAAYKAFASDPGCIFAGTGVVFGDDGLCPLPDRPYEAICPYCSADSFDDIEQALSELEEMIPPEFEITCSACKRSYGIQEINNGNTNWFIASNYIYISDIEPDEWKARNLIDNIKNRLPIVVEIVLAWDT